jgi:hypothetical protein
MNSHPNTIENRKTTAKVLLPYCSDNGKVNGKANSKVLNTHPNTAKGRKVAGKTTNSQVWECLVSGERSNPGNLTKIQKSLGIDTTLRKRVA